MTFSLSLFFYPGSDIRKALSLHSYHMVTNGAMEALEDPRSVARLFVAVEALRLLEPAVLGDAGSA